MSKRKCPFCGGEIDGRYKKCKHCGETIANYKQEHKRINIGNISLCPIPKAGVATIIAIPFIVAINILILTYHCINRLSSWIVETINSCSKLELTDNKKQKFSKMVAICIWVVLFLGGLVYEIVSTYDLSGIKYINCDYTCLADKAYILCKKSKTANANDKAKIYKELGNIQRYMSEEAEYASPSIVENVHKKYRDEDLFPLDMFK